MKRVKISLKFGGAKMKEAKRGKAAEMSVPPATW